MNLEEKEYGEDKSGRNMIDALNDMAAVVAEKGCTWKQAQEAAGAYYLRVFGLFDLKKIHRKFPLGMIQNFGCAGFTIFYGDIEIDCLGTFAFSHRKFVT